MVRPVVTAKFCRLGGYGAISTMVGIVLSGPVAIVALNATFPQPAWVDAKTFVDNYHPSQALPYFGGFFLVGGYLVLGASLHALARDEDRPRASLALSFTTIYAALVFFNYVAQTTFIPALAQRYTADDASIVATFSMVNPKSLAWGLEMWGYGLLGVASWLFAVVFSGTRLERITAATFVANAIVSVATAFLTAIFPGWVMTPIGLGGFVIWNLLAFAMSALTFVALRRRASSGGRDATMEVEDGTTQNAGTLSSPSRVAR
jgi:hypothetical protein